MLIMNKLRNRFNRLNTRERIMLIAFIGVCLAFWWSEWSKGWSAVGEDLRSVREELSVQEVWLAGDAQFRQQLRTLLDQVRVENTLNASELAALVDGMARKENLRHDLTNPETREEGMLRRHSLALSIRNAPLDKLIVLVETIRDAHPYLSLDHISIHANRADPRLLNARLSISALQPRQATVAAHTR